MNKKTILILACALSLALTGCAAKKLTETDARAIAAKACIGGGESINPGVYNEVTKTWWFDAHLKEKKAGCNPACVVTEKTQKAEINWRCAKTNDVLTK
ncbi:MAG: hypothetical protein V1928_02440 [Parcubacteria group bacterium]